MQFVASDREAASSDSALIPGTLAHPPHSEVLVLAPNLGCFPFRGAPFLVVLATRPGRYALRLRSLRALEFHSAPMRQPRHTDFQRSGYNVAAAGRKRCL